MIKERKRFADCTAFLYCYRLIAAVIALAVLVISSTACGKTTAESQEQSSDTESLVTSSISSQPQPASSEEASDISSAGSSSKMVASKSADKAETSSKTVVKPAAPKPPAANGDYHYNTNLNIEDNVFFDSMIYTGYNIGKHRSDGNMWVYILAPRKRGLGYLSNITYGGGSSGYETNASGKPDLKKFEKGGLVCASYVTYVYFNYLPNVAGIDTSMLPRPDDSRLANSWYRASKEWVSKGYSKNISFTASKDSAGFIHFKPSEEIPIGSIINFCDAKKRNDYGSHVVVYAGYKNNYHWVFHVGNSNGPEFCAVERMHFGPDPQWPLSVVTTPSNVRMSALLEINLTDESGSPISGAEFTLKNSKTGKTEKLGTTDSKGRLTKEQLSYGDHVLSYTVPTGYISAATSQNIKLITANNSTNTVNIKMTKKPVSSAPTPSSSKEGAAQAENDAVTSKQGLSSATAS